MPTMAPSVSPPPGRRWRRAEGRGVAALPLFVAPERNKLARLAKLVHARPPAGSLDFYDV